MSDRSEYTSRIEGRVNLSALANAFVIFIGVGSVGSMMALELLAHCGVGHGALVDGSRLERHNLVRHVLGARYLWANKAAAMADYLADVPGLDVGYRDRHIDDTMSDRELDLLLAPADLIVIATDDRRTQRQVAARARALDIPAVIPGLYAQGGGEVFVQLDSANPCFRCWDDFRPADAEVRGATALSADAFAVIQQAIYLCVGVLDTRSAEARELAPPAGDPRPRQLFVARPATNLVRVPMNRRNGCPACRVGPSDVHAPPNNRARSRRSVQDDRAPARDWMFAADATPAPPVLERLTVSEEIVLEGSPVVLSWSAQHATHVRIDGDGPYPTTGELTITVNATRFFTVEAVNPYGSVTGHSATVRVLALPKLPVVELGPLAPTDRLAPIRDMDVGSAQIRWPRLSLSGFSRSPLVDAPTRLSPPPFGLGRIGPQRSPRFPSLDRRFPSINRVWSRTHKER